MPDVRNISGHVGIIVPVTGYLPTVSMAADSLDPAHPGDNLLTPSTVNFARGTATTKGNASFNVNFGEDDTPINSAAFCSIHYGHDELDLATSNVYIHVGNDSQIQAGFQSSIGRGSGSDDYQDVVDWNAGLGLDDGVALQNAGRLHFCFFGRDQQIAVNGRPWGEHRRVDFHMNNSSVLGTISSPRKVGYVVAGTAWHPQMPARNSIALGEVVRGHSRVRQVDFTVDRVHQAEVFSQLNLSRVAEHGGSFRGFFGLFPGEEQMHLDHHTSFPCVVTMRRKNMRHRVALNDSTSHGSTIQVTVTEAHGTSAVR